MPLKSNIIKGSFSLIFIIGFLTSRITGINAVGNQKGSGESKQTIEYDYSDEDVPNGEVADPKSIIKPYFKNSLITVYATKDVENITLECLPSNFNDSRHQILWYNDDHPITNGNTSLAVEKYAVDNKYRLTILNHNKNTAGNFSCAVLPTDVRQYVAIEFGAPPENITNQTGASTKLLIEITLMFSTLISIVSLNYFKF